MDFDPAPRGGRGGGRGPRRGGYRGGPHRGGYRGGYRGNRGYGRGRGGPMPSFSDTPPSEGDLSYTSFGPVDSSAGSLSLPNIHRDSSNMHRGRPFRRKDHGGGRPYAPNQQPQSDSFQNDRPYGRYIEILAQDGSFAGMDPNAVVGEMQKKNKAGAVFDYKRIAFHNDSKIVVEIMNPHDAGTLVSCTGMKMKLGGYVCISVRVQQKDRNANATGESASVSKASDVEMKASSVDLPLGKFGVYLDECVGSGYDENSRILSLDELSHNGFDVDLNNRGTVRKLFETMSRRNISPLFISFQGNRIHSLQSIADAIAEFCPECTSLVLSRNEINSFDELSFLVPLHLTELYLSDNLVNQMDEELYHLEVGARLRHLRLLDGIPLRTGVLTSKSISHLEALNLPSSKKFFADSSTTYHRAVEFFRKYFDLFHRERLQVVLNMYSDASLFSFTLEPPHGFRGRRAPRLDHGTHVDEVENIEMSLSHNMKSNDLVKKETLFCGRSEIFRALEKIAPNAVFGLPALSDMRNLNSFFIYTFHGDLEEPNLSRQYSRTFIVQLQPDGSEVIVNDHLHIRPKIPMLSADDNIQEILSSPSALPQHVSRPTSRSVSDLDMQLVKHNTESAAHPVSSTLQPTGNSLEEKVQQLRNLTRMNQRYCLMALERNEWDVVKAKKNFDEIQSTLPSDAFANE